MSTSPIRPVTDVTVDRRRPVKYKTGYDVDLIGGYDFGMFRLEGELGYKRAKLKSVDVDNAFLTAHQHAVPGTAFTDDDVRSQRPHQRAVGHGQRRCVDFGGNGGVGAYAGGGFGRARVKQLGDSDSAWAWQLLAGVYMPISDNIDVGLKYRYFRTGKLNFNDEFAFSPVGTAALAAAAAPLFFEQRRPFQLAQPARQPDLQLRRASGRRRRRPAAAAAAAACGSGDADVPGRFGDPGDQQLPGSAAAAAAAAAGRARRTRPLTPPLPAQAPSGIAPRTKLCSLCPGRLRNCGAQATIARGIALSLLWRNLGRLRKLGERQSALKGVKYMRKYLLAAAAAAAIASPAVARDGSRLCRRRSRRMVPTSDHQCRVDSRRLPATSVVDYRRGLRLNYQDGLRRRPGRRLRLRHVPDRRRTRLQAGQGIKTSRLDRPISSPRSTPVLGPPIHRRRFRPWRRTRQRPVRNGQRPVRLRRQRRHGAAMSAAASARPGQGVRRQRQRHRMAGASPASTLPVSDNIDIGLKYRYFRTGKLHFGTTTFDVGAGAGDRQRWHRDLRDRRPLQLAQPAARA